MLKIQIKIMPKLRYSNRPIIIVPLDEDDDISHSDSFDEEDDDYPFDVKYLERLLKERLDPGHNVRKYTKHEKYRDSYKVSDIYHGERQRPISSARPFFLEGNGHGFSLAKRQDGLGSVSEKPSAYSLAVVGISVYLAFTLFSRGFGRSTRRTVKGAKKKVGNAGAIIEAKTVAPPIAISKLHDTYAERMSPLPPIKVKLAKEKQEELKNFLNIHEHREHEIADKPFVKYPLGENELPQTMSEEENLSFRRTISELEAKPPTFSKYNSDKKDSPFFLQSNSDSRIPSSVYSKIFEKAPNIQQLNSNQQIDWAKDFDSIRKRIKANEYLELFSNKNRATGIKTENLPELPKYLHLENMNQNKRRDFLDSNHSAKDDINSYISGPYSKLLNLSAKIPASSPKWEKEEPNLRENLHEYSPHSNKPSAHHPPLISDELDYFTLSENIEPQKGSPPTVNMYNFKYSDSFDFQEEAKEIENVKTHSLATKHIFSNIPGFKNTVNHDKISPVMYNTTLPYIQANLSSDSENETRTDKPVLFQDYINALSSYKDYDRQNSKHLYFSDLSKRILEERSETSYNDSGPLDEPNYSIASTNSDHQKSSNSDNHHTRSSNEATTVRKSNKIKKNSKLKSKKPQMQLLFIG
ncbi:uncharacterized protein LOC136041932 isoform X2 [Artemia franciscana]|uniref:Uncharacterized protein n=1 Tax=Artemia franciscana TaxID=6661 RepID=A0AA88H4W6_ARTSF|nr:hypothetical protein QYM36_018174 [Artemia franciscana]